MISANFILVNILFIYACVITRWYGTRDDQWINVCHTLGVSSKTHPNDVLDKLRTVMAQSEIFEQFVEEDDEE